MHTPLILDRKNTLTTSFLVTDYLIKPNEEEMENWRKKEITLYRAEVGIKIRKFELTDIEPSKDSLNLNL
jgi:fructose-1-phosphate kinase PfkB-like protein